MIALTGEYVDYAKDVNIGRTVLITEGMSAMARIKEPLTVLNMRKAREAHQRVIRDNINRYGKLKNFSKNN
ncbi:MAG: hypothetical protein J6A59_13490 [Lachnospiraceae bacterium]|nr:hypothetical protein [Lachnospiraceae bacterium]